MYDNISVVTLIRWNWWQQHGGLYRDEYLCKNHNIVGMLCILQTALLPPWLLMMTVNPRTLLLRWTHINTSLHSPPCFLCTTPVAFLKICGIYNEYNYISDFGLLFWSDLYFTCLGHGPGTTLSTFLSPFGAFLSILTYLLYDHFWIQCRIYFATARYFVLVFLLCGGSFGVCSLVGFWGSYWIWWHHLLNPQGRTSPLSVTLPLNQFLRICSRCMSPAFYFRTF